MEIAWPKDVESATRVQQELCAQVRIEDDFGDMRTIAGVDVSYDIASNLTRAFVVLMDMSDLKIVETGKAELPTDFPYIPGYLSFREIPAVLAALKKLTVKPDLLMVDGQGIAHPRRLGIAAHLGVLTDLPTIGVAKSRLCGRFTDLGVERGSVSPLMDKQEQVGTVLRSKTGCNPLFISPGYRVGQQTALQLVQRCLTTYRLPEPTRLADKLSKQKIIATLL